LNSHTERVQYYMEETTDSSGNPFGFGLAGIMRKQIEKLVDYSETKTTDSVLSNLSDSNNSNHCNLNNSTGNLTRSKGVLLSNSNINSLHSSLCSLKKFSDSDYSDKPLNESSESAYSLGSILHIANNNISLINILKPDLNNPIINNLKPDLNNPIINNLKSDLNNSIINNLKSDLNNPPATNTHKFKMAHMGTYLVYSE